MLMAVFRLAAYFRTPLHDFHMSSDELVYWQAFFDIEPPDQAANQRTAALMAQITNMSGRSLKDGKRVTADEFLGSSKQPKRQSMEEQIAFMKSVTGGNHNGS